jgi:hypothetical protein
MAWHLMQGTLRRLDVRSLTTARPSASVADLMVLANHAACDSAGLSSTATTREFEEKSSAMLDHTIRAQMGPVMQLNYSYWQDKLCLGRCDETMCDGWCEGLREKWRSTLGSGYDLDTSNATVVMLPKCLELFRARQAETGLTPVVAFHTTKNDEIKKSILEAGFIPAEDKGTEHFGHGIHFNTGFPRFPGHDFSCFGRHHFMCLLLLDPQCISKIKYNLGWSITSGVVTVNDKACMLPVIAF